MVQRARPSFHTAWLAALLTGDNACEWSAWFRAHYGNAAGPSPLESGDEVQHAAMVHDVRVDYERRAYQVQSLEENSFRVNARSGATISGAPDLIAVKGNSGVICDVKTGSPEEQHGAQVLLYMWAVPRVFKQWQHVSFSGRLVYRDHEVMLPETAVDEAFIQRLVDLLARVASGRTAAQGPQRPRMPLLPDHDPRLSRSA